AAFGRKKLLYQRILLVGQIALIAQTPALVAPTVLLRPHAPSSRIDAHGGTESQAILPTQENSGRALSLRRRLFQLNRVAFCPMDSTDRFIAARCHVRDQDFGGKAWWFAD